MQGAPKLSTSGYDLKMAYHYGTSNYSLTLQLITPDGLMGVSDPRCVTPDGSAGSFVTSLTA